MTTYFTQFCISVPLTDPKPVRAWMARQLGAADADDATFKKNFVPERGETFPLREAFRLEGFDTVEFNWGVDESGDLVIEADESGNPLQVALFLQQYLITFAPDTVLTFTWANTASRATFDAYGGGACAVSSVGYQMLDAYGWAFKKAEEMRKVLVTKTPTRKRLR